MFTNRKLFAVAAAAVLTLACAKKEEPRRISAEAATAFGRLQAEGMGGTLVLDADALRELGFRPGEGKGADGNLLVELAVQMLPAMAAEMKDDPSADALARSAVLLGLFGQWAKAPDVQRLGVVVNVNPLKPEEAADGALVLLAVREGEQVNRELLQGMGASIRAATGRDLVRTEAGQTCVARDATPELPFQVCVQAGAGFFALGTAKALSALATGSTAPAPREPGALLHLLVRAPQLGRVEVTVEGRAALHVAAAVEPLDPAMAEQLEKGIQAGLLAYDAQAERQRGVMARALTEVKGSLEKDADAPPRLKGAAAGATAEKLLDPRGEYAALRSSIKVARSGSTITAEMTVPEAQVRRFTQIDQGMTMVATTGVLAAIAIPNFIRYQCRSKQAEGAVTLNSAWAAMELHRAEHRKYPTHPDQLELPGTGRYTLCMRSGCAGRVNPVAATACEQALAGLPGGPKAPAVCAAADVMEDGKLDVWVVDRTGVPSHVRNGCQ